MDDDMGSVLAAIVMGVPALFWGTRMTLSGYYERENAIQSGQQASAVKLGIGAGLMILGIALLGAVTKVAFFR